MIVVVGQPLFRESKAGATVDGLPARIALAAAAHGCSVQLVGKAGEDEAGDAVILALGQGGVGHVALLREAGRPTSRAASAGEDAIEVAAQMPTGVVDAGGTLEAADVELALRYLTDFAVLVLADPAGSDLMRVVSSAASWADSRLIVVVRVGEAAPDGLPSDVIAFEAPESDPDGVFAAMVGSFAAALDNGGDPGEAFRSSVDSGGWTPKPAE